MNPAANRIQLEIFFDLVCPFCLIGKVELDKTLALSHNGVDIRWTPLILDSGIPPEGYDFQTFHRSKYGDRARPMQIQVEKLGEALGLQFDFLRLEKYPNTLDAHRAVRFAAEHGKANDMVSALLRAYFLERQDIGSRQTLGEIADGRLGLDGDALIARLSTNWQVEDIIAEHHGSVARGARSVPSYVLNGERIEHTHLLLPALQRMAEFCDSAS